MKNGAIHAEGTDKDQICELLATAPMFSSETLTASRPEMPSKLLNITQSSDSEDKFLCTGEFEFIYCFKFSVYIIQSSTNVIYNG